MMGKMMGKMMLERSRFISIGIFILLLLFLPSLISGKYIGKNYEHFVLLVGMFSVLYTNWHGVLYQKTEEQLVLFGILTYLLALTGFFSQTDDLTRFAPVMEVYLKSLIPLVLLSMLYLAKIKNINILFFGVALGIGVASFMTVFAVLQNLPRGGGTLHGAAIIFGNLSMLLGVLNIVFAFYYFSKSNRLFYFFLLMGGLGIIASLFSGTRGGWIVLVTLPFVLIPFVSKQYRIKVIVVTAGIMLLGLSFIFLTENMMKTRLFQAYTEVSQMLSSGEFSSGSLGLRFELWRASFLAFLSSPFVGIGVGEFYAFKLGLINLGELPKNIASFKHSHNEYFSILSGMGLVGIIFYTVFFVWLWRIFSKAALSTIKEVKYLGFAGISTIVCYLDFSLSESFLTSHSGIGAFYFLMTLFIYFINQYSNKSSYVNSSI